MNTTYAVKIVGHDVEPGNRSFDFEVGMYVRRDHEAVREGSPARPYDVMRPVARPCDATMFNSAGAAYDFVIALRQQRRTHAVVCTFVEVAC